MNNTEIERKFLIKLPDTGMLSSKEGCEISDIVQTYLVNPDGFTERVRRRTYPDKTVYYHTLKKRLSKASSFEKEDIISESEYEDLLTRADASKQPIHKQRCVIPYAGHKLEIDIYGFWKKQAVLEIELETEDEAYSIPDWLEVIREVTGDHAYSNSTLSKCVPDEDPDGAPDDGKSWFTKARFGLMLHWGLYSLLAGEYKGQRMGGVDDGRHGELGEWAMTYFRIPIREYERLAQAFNPVEFDADEYVRLAKDAGMGYIVITSKHHEGFALFKSECDRYNVCDATPFRRDIIAELAAACRKYGVKLGLYYSQELDWHEQNGGGYSRGLKNLHSSWTNDWDFPDNASKDFSLCFEKKIKPQVKEILTQYGDIALIWFDTPWEITEAQSRELYELVKQYQPFCLVNSRIGNGMGDYTSMGDNQVPDGKKDSGMLFETAATLNDTWGYKSYDQHWKSAADVITLLTQLASRNVNYLLNVGPDPLGRIPAPAQNILREVGSWLKVNGEAVYGTKPSPYDTEPVCGPVTENGDSLYFVLNDPSDELVIPGILTEVNEVQVLGKGRVPFSQEAELVRVKLPELSGMTCPVVKLTAPGGIKVRRGVIELPGKGFVLTPLTAAISGNISISRACDTEGWTDAGSLSWEFSADTEGEFELLVTANSSKSAATSPVRISMDINGETVTGTAGNKACADTLQTRYRPVTVSHMGRVRLPAGENRVTLSLASPAAEAFRFTRLELTRVTV